MWSGPRNLSTALMRSFGSRRDCFVIDEPFYAAYLVETGADHPMREAIISAHECDWRKVAAGLCAPRADGPAILYQKHMTHHMVDPIDRGWMEACRNGFLIRHPARVLASYARKREVVTARDIGFFEQAALFDRAAEYLGAPPPVIDADDLLAEPKRMLMQLCAALGIAFDPAMLRWESGPRATDGIWGEHWYEAVNRSLGFGAPTPMPQLDDDALRRIAEETLPAYERLRSYALR